MTIGSKGIIQHMREGSVLVDHTTSLPGLAEKIAEQGKARGVGCVDAPVSGGDIGAQNGQLVIMCGAEKELLDKVYTISYHNFTSKNLKIIIIYIHS